MNIRFWKKIFIIFIFLFSMPGIMVAIDTINSGRILDDFKEKQKEILFDTSTFSDTGANAILEQEYVLNGLDGLKQKLVVMQTIQKIKKDLATQKRVDLETALAVIDKAIADTFAQIQDTELHIREKEILTQDLIRSSIDMKKKIAQNRAVILRYLAQIYTEENMISDGDGNVDIFRSMILSEKDVDFFLQDMTYKSLITLLGQKFVDEYRTLVKEYYLIMVRIGDERRALETLRQWLTIQKQNIEFQREERQKLLEITKWQEALFQNYIEASERAKKTVELAWQEADKRYKTSIEELFQKNGCTSPQKKKKSQQTECDRLEVYFKQEMELRKIQFATGTVNIFQWPVKTRKISTYFRDAQYHTLLWSQHEAIDIPVNQGTEVMSVAPGYVYYILPPKSGWYSYLAIRHRDWLVTVYGHLSEILVEQNQFVDAGSVIAKSGWAPGTPWAGPMTSGPHLHFEVWKNQESQDPLGYLNLADLDYSQLAWKYESKFITDLMERMGDTVDTSQFQKKFIIRGVDEQSRQIFLLNRYATPDFRNWDMWVDSALAAKLDPSFVMCVWLAETGLGNHLKTAFNVWNIWNTDSGGTYSFSSPKEWITWMTKTFNNKYLSQYQKLSDLSRWGNDDGSIYASSSANWHNNIVRCISALKWRYVGDDFQFRVDTGE
jgi:murein DD-endopeptidase MepM/ murein hydrolase activator NlpD